MLVKNASGSLIEDSKVNVDVLLDKIEIKKKGHCAIISCVFATVSFLLINSTLMDF